MSPASKLLMISMVIAATLLYSVVERRKIDSLQTRSLDPILKTMPEIEILDVYQDVTLNQASILKEGERGVFVHIWGTWCAPCEAELPDFVDFAAKFENQGVRFVLLAVNDEYDKVKSFVETRLKRIPDNITIALDAEGKTMIPFGTVKVPETYLFGSDLKTLTKFIGPQDWRLAGFVERTNRLLLENRK